MPTSVCWINKSPRMTCVQSDNCLFYRNSLDRRSLNSFLVWLAWVLLRWSSFLLRRGASIQSGFRCFQVQVGMGQMSSSYKDWGKYWQKYVVHINVHWVIHCLGTEGLKLNKRRSQLWCGRVGSGSFANRKCEKVVATNVTKWQRAWLVFWDSKALGTKGGWDGRCITMWVEWGDSSHTEMQNHMFYVTSKKGSGCDSKRAKGIWNQDGYKNETWTPASPAGFYFAQSQPAHRAPPISSHTLSTPIAQRKHVFLWGLNTRKPLAHNCSPCPEKAPTPKNLYCCPFLRNFLNPLSGCSLYFLF